MSAFKIGSRKVGPGEPTFVLAEIGTNHDGDLDRALRLISLAATAGADGVKFQLFRAAEVYPDNIGIVEVCGRQYDFFAYLESTEMPIAWLPALRKRCRAEKVAFVVTPFDLDALQQCLKAKVDAIKIASAELNYYQLVSAAAAARPPLILSTGFSTAQEVIDAVHWCRAQECDHFMLLQCTAAYPAEPVDCHLAVMDRYAEQFGCPVGFSDHTAHPRTLPLIAVAQGASLIEKHFTDDRTRPGADHAFAIEPDELAELVIAIRLLETDPDRRLNKHVTSERITEALGSSIKTITPPERAIYPCEKRAVRARHDIEPGEIFGPDNIGCLRFVSNGSTGLPTSRFDELIGATAARRIDKGDGVTEADIAARSAGTPETSATRGPRR